MEFTNTTIRGLFDSKIQFCIPVYQRAYSWEEENWDVFLDDLIQQINRENSYSYGTLLLETIKKDQEYDIIDGQQRLTTIIIFMRALYNVMQEYGYDESSLEDISESFFKRKNIIKLRPVESDRSCFDTVIIENEEYAISSTSQENIVGAKKYFLKKLNTMSLKQLENLKDIVLDSSISKLVMSGKKEAALMFELQNNRGRDLTNMEKLKSFFMYQMYVESSAEETDSNIETIANYFKEIYKNVYDIKGLSEDSVLMYHCYAYMKNSFSYRNITDIKKDLATSNDHIQWMKDFTKELSITSNNLKKLQLCNCEYYNKLKRLYDRNSLPAFVYPFIIKGYKYFENNSTDLNVLFHILEILVLRYRLISSRADINSRLSPILRDFNGDLTSLKDSLKRQLNDSWYWSDKRIEEYLKGYMYENPALHYILWQYEESIQAKGYKIGTLVIEGEQIEHISPQTEPKEAIAAGYEVDENNHYTQEFIDKYLNCLGNLMLIAASQNASIGNKPFITKLDSYNNNPLLNQQAEIKTFLSDNKVEWKKSQIENRLNKILSFALKKWDFENV